MGMNRKLLVIALVASVVFTLSMVAILLSAYLAVWWGEPELGFMEILAQYLTDVTFIAIAAVGGSMGLLCIFLFGEENPPRDSGIQP